jgi:two-component system cell cycle sensor histidine kinase/response regulator CckA
VTHAVGAAPLRVLLIDDDSDHYVLTRDMLDDERWRYTLDWAPTFEAGLDRLASGQYDVALVDYRLGERTGVELLRTEISRRTDVPSIVLTADDDRSVDLNAMDAGAVEYLVKGEVTAPVLMRALRYAVERHRAVTQLKQQEGSLRALLQDSSDVILLVTRDGEIRFASDSVSHVENCRSDDLVGRRWLDRIHVDDLGRVQESFDACLEHDGSRSPIEYRQEHRDGSWRRREATIVNRLAQPGLAAIVVTYRDITARRRAESHQAHLAAIVESSDDAIYSRTLDGQVLSWNDGARRLFGYSAEEIVGERTTKLWGADSAEIVSSILERSRSGACVRQVELTGVRKDGSRVPVLLTASPIRDQAGCIVGVATVAHDISLRKRVETALVESEAEYRSTFDDAPVGIAHTSLEGRWLRTNRRLRSLLGYSAEQLQATDFLALTHPEDVEDNSAGRAQLLAGEVPHFAVEKRYRRADGTYLWVQLTVSVHRDPSGNPQHFIAIVEDISGRKQAQLELDHIFNLSPDMICTSNYAGYFTRTNPAWTRILGYSPDELRARPFASFVHPDDRAATAIELDRLAEGATTFGFTNRYRNADGSYRWIEWNAQADPAAQLIYAVARDQSSRMELEQQLRQAQKMEAIGRLAGGVAHDFNNLLTAILGFAELAMAELAPGDPKRDDIQQILSAGQSAASLTRQLLAFSRKQILKPQILDVNAVVLGMQTLLRRVIGEDIECVIELGEHVPRINADRGQVEQVVMNLAVNARDAMPTGGALRISTGAVDLDNAFVTAHPGSRAGVHVRLTLSDTGIGMGSDVLSHLFEPFFTTKELGKGTGLGLATVYGIVKQSGGYISVESAPGRGTAFMLDFPAAWTVPVQTSAAEATGRAVSGTETILLVEDQREVRHAIRQTLERSHYQVIEAADGPAALAVLQDRPERVDLLLTDVVMPGMSGRVLVDLIAGQGRCIRVLYMSGYTDDAIVQHGVLSPGVDFIQKPFRPEELLASVRDVLDRQTGLVGTQ